MLFVFSSSTYPQTHTTQLYNTHPDSCKHMDRISLDFNLALRNKNNSHCHRDIIQEPLLSPPQAFPSRNKPCIFHFFPAARIRRCSVVTCLCSHILFLISCFSSHSVSSPLRARKLFVPPRRAVHPSLISSTSMAMKCHTSICSTSANVRK